MCHSLSNSLTTAFDPNDSLSEWAWLKTFCIAVRTADALTFRDVFHGTFTVPNEEKISEDEPYQSMVRELLQLCNTIFFTSLFVVVTQLCVERFVEKFFRLRAFVEFQVVLHIQQFIAIIVTPPRCVFQDNSAWSLTMDEQVMTWATQRPEQWETGGKCDAYLWGGGRHGQLAESGRGVNVPTITKSFSNAQQIVCGQNCTFVLQGNGTVMACGEGSYGRLGMGNSDDLLVLTPVAALQGEL